MNYLEFTKKIAKEAGEIVMSYQKKTLKIEEKSRPGDLVTEADKKVEAFLIQKIKKTFPFHEFLGEETGSSKDKVRGGEKNEFRWIIDPIDGTKNFIRGIPFFAVSIGLEYRGKRIVGVVYNPAQKDLFAAEKGKGASQNNKKIHVSKAKTVQESLFATGFHPAYKHTKLEIFKEIINNSQGIRRFGSAALDLCYVANGTFDGFWEFGLYPWDIAAAILIVEEAGGRVTNTDGTPLKYEQKTILATNKKIHPETLQMIKKAARA